MLAHNFLSLDSLVRNFRRMGRKHRKMYCGPNFKVQEQLYVRVLDPRGRLKSEDWGHNLITNTALNDVLNEYIRGTTQITAWYMSLVDNSGFSAFAAADTASSHAGWSENQNYSQSTRPQWSPGAASSQSITNSSSVNFSMTGTVTIRGIFIISNSTIGGTTGTLFSEAAFSGGNQSVNNGDTLQATYSLSLASN
jgi:hypothetical protein